jgi:cell division septum initiation protein DivIVA
MSDKVIKLQGGIPKNTSKPHYDKDEVDALISQVDTDSVQGDVDTLSAANDYTDTKISELIGGAPASTLDTIKEIADALQNEQSATGSILATQSSQQTQINNNATNISNEITNRQNADSTLQSNIDAEAAARSSGDTSTLNSAKAYTDTQISSQPNATQSVKGLMSSTDKTKLDGIATGATANSTDAQLRDRSTHTGTQPASTISNFTAAVLAAAISGLSTATGTAVVNTDTVLIAIGKLQAQVNNISSNISVNVRSTVLTGLSVASSAVITASDTVISSIGKLQAQISENKTTLTAHDASVTPSPTGISNTVGTSTAHAKADHVHETILTRFRKVDNIPFQTTSITYTPVTNMVITPTIAGTYMLDYTCICTSSANNATMNSALFKNGAVISDTEGQITGRMNSVDILHGSGEIYFNGTTDSIDLRVNVTGATLITGNRRIRIIRIGP